MNLQWEFYRQITTAESLGANIHYYDEMSQSIFLDGGNIETRICKVPKGHWKDSIIESIQNIGSFDYSLMAFDHPHSGSLYGIASDVTSLFFIRYVYAMDISDIYESGQWQEQIDNQVKMLSLDVKNIKPDMFVGENTLFNPGAKLTVGFSSGDSDSFNIGVAYLDDVEYDAYASTIPLSARNIVGYYLSGQTYDERNLYTGGRSTVYSSILRDAGIAEYYIQSDDTPTKLQFNPDTIILDGLNESLTTIGWRLVDLPTGEIVIGDEGFIGHYNANGRYTFNGGKEAFKRKTSKSADAAFTRICVRNPDGLSIYRPVPYWDYWSLGKRKTKYYDAPEGYKISDMERMAQSLVSELQYVGIGENFTSPIRPQLQVGDIAEIYYEGDTETTSLGIITQVTHQFGQNGFFTDFSLDSGGTATDATGYVIADPIVSKASSALSGYNRKQRITDFIGITAQRKAVSVYSGGGQTLVSQSVPVDVLSTAPASIFIIL